MRTIIRLAEGFHKDPVISEATPFVRAALKAAQLLDIAENLTLKQLRQRTEWLASMRDRALEILQDLKNERLRKQLSAELALV